jgi:hypothetical protein
MGTHQAMAIAGSRKRARTHRAGRRQPAEPLLRRVRLEEQVRAWLADWRGVLDRQVAWMHGGMSTGPHTAAGLEAIRRSRTIHGFYSHIATEQRRQARTARRLFADLLDQRRG